MKQKDLLLWVIVIAAFLLSTVVLLEPKSLVSDAARVPKPKTKTHNVYRTEGGNYCFRVKLDSKGNETDVWEYVPCRKVSVPVENQN